MNNAKTLFSALSFAALAPMLEESTHHIGLGLEAAFEAYTHPVHSPAEPLQHGYGRRIAINGTRRKGRAGLSISASAA